MASKLVEDAVSAYLAANWSNSAILAENDQAEAPADGSAFIILQFPVANTSRVALGNRAYREEGGFRIVINVERGSGTDTIREWGATLVSLFRDVEFSGVHCLVPADPFTDDQSDKGNFFQGAIIVPYWFNFAG